MDEVDSSFITPLWYAAFNGHLEVVKWIIASGRQFDAEKKGNLNGEMLTPIEAATKSKKTAIVALLEDFNRDPNQTRLTVRTALGITVRDHFDFFFIYFSFDVKWNFSFLVVGLIERPRKQKSQTTKYSFVDEVDFLAEEKKEKKEKKEKIGCGPIQRENNNGARRRNTHHSNNLMCEPKRSRF